MNKFLTFAAASLFALISHQLFSEEKAVSAYSVIKEAASKDSLEQSVSYISKTIPEITSPAEKRALLIFYGSLQEQQGLYAKAIDSYVKAASIAGGNAKEMPKKSNETLVLDAVRCALNMGDWQTAQNYLNSSVRNSSDPKILALIKLYEQCCILSKAENIAETEEAVLLLQTYTTLSSMKPVLPKILLILWNITGKTEFADSLKKNCPNSPEAAIVKGEIQTMPTPFYFFIPRSQSGVPEISVTDSSPEKQAEKTTEPAEKIIRQQLGLFKEKENAQFLVESAREKGFNARITTETRPSGTTYFLVVVDEEKNGGTGDLLRSSGFECYPIFQ